MAIKVKLFFCKLHWGWSLSIYSRVMTSLKDSQLLQTLCESCQNLSCNFEIIVNSKSHRCSGR
jgi:hypothetical protein